MELSLPPGIKSEQYFKHAGQSQQSYNKNDRNNPENNLHSIFLSHNKKVVMLYQVEYRRRSIPVLRGQLNTYLSP